MAALTPLSTLAGRAAGPQAVGLEAGQTWERLARRRAAWSARVGGPGDAIGLHLSDGFEFAAALLGAWSAGVSVVLPGDAAPETLRALGAHVRRLFIGDASAPADAPSAAPPPAAMPGVPIVVFTSGTSGQATAVPKPLHCIQNELAALEEAFGGGLEGAGVLSTVSHQHYYGLLFKVLWPLSAGRPFLARQLRLPEEIAAAASRTGACALVSSPALLKRIGGSPAALEALAPARAVMAAVFSSGGPLPWEAVLRSRSALGCAPTEVYGSSETGGVAWRRRERETDPWLALPGVETEIRADGILALRSGHGPTPGWILSDELAAATEGGFHLLGRVDRIVKVEEKRVSLAALERALAAHASVAEARVLPLKGAREMLGAVVRLKGAAPQEAAGRRVVSEGLRRHLEGTAEATSLPRRWRFVDSMPVDSMGKTTQAALRALFDEQEVSEPECLYVQGLEKGVELCLFLPESLRWFKGHFPGHPLLPGVVQLHWAMRAAREHLHVRGVFQGLRALKFMRPIRPGKMLTLTLLSTPGGFEFRYASEEGKHAGGHVLLA
jgi:acyl-coenzyme A synthetase/AMP-(fatty) acid ligase